jgi:hypothetical protein
MSTPGERPGGQVKDWERVTGRVVKTVLVKVFMFDSEGMKVVVFGALERGNLADEGEDKVRVEGEGPSYSSPPLKRDG